MTDLVPVAAGSRLEPFARAGVLEASDIHLANLVCRIGGESNCDVSLAIALSSVSYTHLTLPTIYSV